MMIHSIVMLVILVYHGLTNLVRASIEMYNKTNQIILTIDTL